MRTVTQDCRPLFSREQQAAQERMRARARAAAGMRCKSLELDKYERLGNELAERETTITHTDRGGKEWTFTVCCNPSQEKALKEFLEHLTKTEGRAATFMALSLTFDKNKAFFADIERAVLNALAQRFPARNAAPEQEQEREQAAPPSPTASQVVAVSLDEDEDEGERAPWWMDI